MFRPRFLALCCVLFCSARLFASAYGSITGIIHDAEHRPIANAEIEITPQGGEPVIRTKSDDKGSFRLLSVPTGEYSVTVSSPAFAQQQRKLTVYSDRTTDLHLQLDLARLNQSVTVSADASETEPVSDRQMITQKQIEQTPGADEANSLAIITSSVPGAVIAHDQLHVRGGHQVTWMIDGIEVPNTNIASNVGPQFDPKDMAYLEAHTGAYSADVGDRTYGVFNAIPKSGFERSGDLELLTSYGSQNTTDDQVSYGIHTNRLAYFGSVSGNLTDVGLEAPVDHPVHDAASGLSAFSSLIFNQNPHDQLRVLASARTDHFQVPLDPSQSDQTTRDSENERDAFATVTWLHTLSDSASLAISPFFHFNQAHYTGASQDTSTNSDRGSNYFGGSVHSALQKERFSMRTGVFAFAQRENDLFQQPELFRSRTVAWGSTAAVYADGQIRPKQWLILDAGVRGTYFSGGLTEHSVDPRVGATVILPKIHWSLHSYYGRYYQAPPLVTVGDALSSALTLNGVGFVPLHGERDIQREFGLTIPWKGWTAGITHFQTSAKNYFDHDVLGNSNVFLPLTIAAARIRGWEATIQTPDIEHLRTRFVYSHQTAQGRGAVSGGLTDFSPGEDAFFFLDHDQRDTLSISTQASWGRTWAAVLLNYGSGFLDGNGPEHLPSNFTAGLSVGRQITRSLGLRLSATNIADDRFLIDRSNTFGGTHHALPRRISVQLRYRFGREGQ